MNKHKTLIIAAAIFTVIGAIPLLAFTSSNDSTMVVETENDEFIESVEAQNMNGTETRTFNVYGRRKSNGKYWFFVKTSTREFGIQYADRNKYKPFYIKIGDERWYFASKTLDLYSFKTDQW